MKYYVYKHTFKNGTVYFGKGSHRRIYSNKRNKYWVNLYLKYGEPKREYLNTELPEELAFLLEKTYIDQAEKHNINTCNLSKGGEASASGHHHTAEAKYLISIGVSSYWKSKALAEGREPPRSKHDVTPRNTVLCNIKGVIQLTKNGDFVFEYKSIREATKHTGINGGNISSVCNNKLKAAGGFQWKYKEKKELAYGNN